MPSGDWFYLQKHILQNVNRRVQTICRYSQNIRESYLKIKKNLPLGHIPRHSHITSMSSTLSQSLESLVIELRALECSEPTCLPSTQFKSLSELGELLPN